MRSFVRFFVVAVVLFAVVAVFQAGPLSAQNQEAPKNLKVLPKDMSRREVVGIMRGFSHALGVRCDACHTKAKGPGARPDELDYALDDKPEKEAARKMMKMVASINEQIGQMNFEDKVQVSCVTCHHGLKQPETLTGFMMKAVDKGGVDGAIADYRKLRNDYFGSGAYDFTGNGLNEAAGNLAESKKDYDGAIKILKLSLEFAPNDAESYVLMGRAQVAKGDKPAATASFQKALELDPENRWAKMQLEQLKGGQ